MRERGRALLAVMAAVQRDRALFGAAAFVLFEALLSTVLVGGHTAAELDGSGGEMVRALLVAYAANLALSAAACFGGALLVAAAAASVAGRTTARGLLDDLALIRQRASQLAGLVVLEALLRFAVVELLHTLGDSDSAYLAKGLGRILWFLLAFLALEAVVLDGCNGPKAIARSVSLLRHGRRRARGEARALRQAGVLGATGSLVALGIALVLAGLLIAELGPDTVGMPLAITGLAVVLVESCMSVAIGAVVGVAAYRALRTGTAVQTELEPWLGRHRTNVSS